MGRYDDIINLPHHQSKTRKHMSMQERAAQFAPYMSLKGFDSEIFETSRITDDKIELGEEKTEHINAVLNSIKKTGTQITLTYYVPDEKKPGGAYVTVGKSVKRVDDIAKKLIFTDGSEVAFDDIADISVATDDDTFDEK